MKHVIFFAAAFFMSVSTANAGECEASKPCKVDVAAPIDAGKKLQLVPVFTMSQIDSGAPVALSGRAQFRLRQLMAWCVAAPECKASLTDELERHEGPWADVADNMLSIINDPAAVALQSATWSK